MKISEASKFVGYNDKVVEDAFVLTKLFAATGDTSKSGYLDDSITGMKLDDNGNLQFDSYREKDGRIIISNGVVYNNCVLIKQHENVGKRDYYQLYSWDIESKNYTFVSFDNLESMDECFEKLRKTQTNLHNEDISLKFAELGVSFDDIAQVRLNQTMNSFSLDDMFKERVANEENLNLFKR